MFDDDTVNTGPGATDGTTEQAFDAVGSAQAQPGGADEPHVPDLPAPTALASQSDGIAQAQPGGADEPHVPDLPAPTALASQSEVIAQAQPVGTNEQYVSDYPTPTALADQVEVVWNEDDHPIDNYVRLGQHLAAIGDLYRRPGYANGLLLASQQPNIEPVVIDKGSRLASVIMDRLRVRCIKCGNSKGNHVPSNHLNTMLATEAFLQCFRPIDDVVKTAFYLPNFELISAGYNDGGPGQRLLHVGPAVTIAHGTTAIDAFLNVMDFAANADRTNTVGLALTEQLRNFWLGAKPIGIVTSDKSHGGKDTVVAFAAGSNAKTSMDYQSTDWAFRQGLIAAIKSCPGVGLINIENARLGRGENGIASATLERFLTDPEPALHSTKTNGVLRIKNNLVLTITTNFGSVSEDLMNRGLPIHLSPIGNVADRDSPIGNPKNEYLPTHCVQIEAELRYMIKRWVDAGCPLDMTVKHPFSASARTIGGILMVNGYRDFLANYSQRKTSDDPIRKALGILGVAYPNQWLSATDWASKVVVQGLVRTLIAENDRETEASKARGIGVCLSAHQDETFVVETDDATVTLRLKKNRGRIAGGEPTMRYQFLTLTREPLPEEIAPVPPNQSAGITGVVASAEPEHPMELGPESVGGTAPDAGAS